jgi:hypothetical protein
MHTTQKQGITRRKFLQSSLALGTALSLETLLNSCATIGLKETGPVIYPPLKGHKVQPPENGCLFGIGLPLTAAKFKDSDYYGPILGKKPAVQSLEYRYSIPSQLKDAIHLTKQNVIPYLQIAIQNLEDFVKGKNDRGIQKFAEASVELGKVNGGFFLCPMWEMNIDWKLAPWSWCGQPSRFQQAWQHIWNIFEEERANEFATWVIEYHIDFPFGRYWPGDKFVDWIGFSGYNRNVHSQYYGYRHFNQLFRESYASMRRKNKPIMISEMGTTVDEDQHKWIADANKSIKRMPGIKAALYWDNVNTELGDDHTLNPKSLETLTEILKDPYWILAK